MSMLGRVRSRAKSLQKEARVFYSGVPSSAPRNSKGRRGINRAPEDHLTHLQSDLLRLEGRFNSRLHDAFLGLEESSEFVIRHAALTRHVAMASAAVDIAISPNPQLGMLDMTAFFEINAAAFKRHWIPNRFGEQGNAVLASLEVSRLEAWEILGKSLNAAQLGQVSLFLSRWIKSQTELTAADGFRISEFSDAVEGQRSGGASSQGIAKVLRQVRQAVFKADSARLLGERALYYSQRAPFLLRLQARATVLDLFREGFSDAKAIKNTPLVQKVRQKTENLPEAIAAIEMRARALLKRTSRKGMAALALLTAAYVFTRFLPARETKRLVRNT